MKHIKHYFGEMTMTWPRVLLLAVSTAVLTALVAIIPALQDTSFHDIAVAPDCWFLFAIFIVVNCRTWWDASLKCFTFFLVSQPLIYLLQVPFSWQGWHLFQYYPRWFIITLLTLPGAALAFLVKKKNWLSVLVLSVATGYLAMASAHYIRALPITFPYHLISAVFCLAAAIFLVFVLLDKKRHRIAALVLIVLLFTGMLLYSLGGQEMTIFLESGEWTYETEDSAIVSVSVTNGNRVTLAPRRDGMATICFENGEGEREFYRIEVKSGLLVSVESRPEETD